MISASPLPTRGGAAPLPRPRPIAKFPTALFFVALMGAVSRGVFEMLVGRTLAYAVQVVLISAFALALFLLGRPSVRPHTAPAVLLWWVFVLAALLSMFASLNLSGVDYSTVFVVVMTFFATLLVAFGQVRYQFSHTERIGPVVITVAAVLMAVGLLQQFAGLSVLPGTDRGTFGDAALRPSSLTGSFLHYPIALALLCFVLMGLWATYRRTIYLLAALAGVLCVVVSYSRSGVVLVGAGLFLSIFFMKRASSRLRIIGAVGVGLLVAAAVLPSGGYVERILSIFDTQGAGNVTRIRAWTSIVELWSSSPLVIGSHAGEYTNVTTNFSSAAASGVTESGVLQLLISFGVLGLVGYYGLMVLSIFATADHVPWYRAGIAAGIVQTIFYQSTEVLPFMVILTLIPVIASLTGPPADVLATTKEPVKHV